MKLSAAAFGRAQRFLLSQARELEKCLFDFHFGAGEASRRSVVAALKAYQNPDGGFGNGLEPDVRMEASSVVATKFALQILIDVQTPATERLVLDGVAYVLRAFDEEKRVWPLVSDEVMNAPHAPWWDAAGLETEFGSYLTNPRAGLLRCLLEYRELVEASFLDSLVETVMEHFGTMPIDMPLFDATSLLLLLQSEGLSEAHRRELRSGLEETAVSIVAGSPDEWQTFAVKPLWLAPSPVAPLADVLASQVQKNLAFEIAHQNGDGSWSPTWSWGAAYPDSWNTAEREWKGILTLATLRSLRDYGRIEGCPPTAQGYKYPID